MCRRRTRVTDIFCGHERTKHRSFHRWGSFFSIVLLGALATPLRSEARASNAAGVQKLTNDVRIHDADRDDPSVDRGEEEWLQENIYVGRSGDPWGSMSMKHVQDNVFLRLYENTTRNNTGSTRLPAYGRSLTRTRLKRGVIHLYNMVVCATGCNPLAYKGYGCYCGFLGSGYVIDGIDRCCKMHDWCYDATDCVMFSEYFVPYYWRCYHGYKPVCAVEHGDWGGSGSCAQRLCECDRSLAECLRRYPCPTTKAVCTSSPWRLVQNLFMIM